MTASVVNRPYAMVTKANMYNSINNLIYELKFIFSFKIIAYPIALGTTTLVWIINVVVPSAIGYAIILKEKINFNS